MKGRARPNEAKGPVFLLLIMILVLYLRSHGQTQGWSIAVCRVNLKFVYMWIIVNLGVKFPLLKLIYG